MDKGTEKAKTINATLKQLYDKESTNKYEKRALLDASSCVWRARRDKVVNIDSFMELLYDYMGFDYDVDVKETDTGTIFIVKTFKKR